MTTEQKTDTVKITVDGLEMGGPARRPADPGRPGQRRLIPASAGIPHAARRHVPHVPRPGGRALVDDRPRLHHSCGRRDGRRHPERHRRQSPGGRPRIPAHQPSARLPGVRPRRRMPAPGPDHGLRAGESRFVEEKRHYEKPIQISELVLPTGSAASSAPAAPASPRRSRATRSSSSSGGATTPRSTRSPTSPSGPTSPATPSRSARWAPCSAHRTASGPGRGT